MLEETIRENFNQFSWQFRFCLDPWPHGLVALFFDFKSKRILINDFTLCDNYETFFPSLIVCMDYY